MPGFDRAEECAMKRLLLGAILFWLLAAILCCVSVPVTHRKALNIVPYEKEVALGEEAYRAVLSKERLSDNARWTAVLRRVGKNIAAVSDMPNLRWEFNLLDSNRINAFCLPGGKVAVYTGIMPLAKSEAGLAAIIGHEVAHAVARHAAERMSQALLVEVGLGLADISLQNSRYRNIILASLGLGAQVGVLLPYSRQHEKEADEIGIHYMARAGYDPGEAVRLWERFSQHEAVRVPEFLSTHPASPKRVDALRALLPEAEREYQRAPRRYGLGEAL